jgi:hypothetical protein
VAIATTTLLAVGMLAVGSTTAIAAPAPVLTATEVPIGGGPVTITGTGFAGVTPGVYLGLAGQGLGGFYASSSSPTNVASETVFIGVAQVSGVGGAGRTEPMTPDGTFSVTINVPEGDASSFAVYTSKAHGQGFSDTSQNATLNLAYAAPVVVEPPVVEPPVVEPPVVVPPVLTSTEVPDGGGAVTITGTGFAGVAPGIYLGLAGQGLGGFYAASSSPTNVASETVFIGVGQVTGVTGAGRTEPMTTDGTFSVTITVPAGDASSFAVYTSKAHGQGFADTSQNASLNLAYAAPVVVEPPVVEPPVVEPPVVEPPVVEPPVVEPPVVEPPVVEPPVVEPPVVEPPVVATPTITVTEIPDGGGAVTVTGSGFSTTAPGIYVAAGNQGSGNLYNTPGVNVRNAVAVSTTYTEATPTRAIMSSTGSFTTTITLPEDDGTKWAIYTSKAQGLGAAADLTQNTTTNLVYATPVVVEPPVVTPPVVDPPVVTPPVVTPPVVTPPTDDTDEVTVIEADTNSNGLAIGYTEATVAGGTVTISGSGYDIASPGIYVGVAPRGFAGFYAASAELLPGTVHVKVGNVDGETAAGRTAPMNADGTFSITFAVPADDGTEYAIYTSKAHGQGVSDTSQDAVVDFAYDTRRVLAGSDIGAPETPIEIPVTPVVVAPAVNETPAVVTPAAEEVCVARSVSGASLNWAIKDSFRTYIRGGIANGSWDLSSVGDAGGKFVWSGGTGAYNTDANRGTISYPGTVHFTGHDGQLDITITDVKVRIASASSATLTASFNSTALDGTVTNVKNVAFANVAINSASTTGSKLTISNASTTLTTAGAVAFGGFYDAGAELAPLSLTAPLGGTVECTDSTYSSLATTGTNDLTGGLLLAALLALGGVGALSLTRRRTNRTAEMTSI